MAICEICEDENMEEYADPNLKGVCVFCTEEVA